MKGHLSVFSIVTAGMILAGVLCARGAEAPANADAANPLAGIVAEVQVRGNKIMTTNAILAMVKLRAGLTYDEAILRADEQKLLATGRFNRVETEKTQTSKGIIITFVVFERPTISKIYFHGNKVFSDADLSKELGMAAGGPLSGYTAEAGRQAILKKYRGEGYYFVEVSYDKNAVESQQQLSYTIVEGPQVKVRKLRFQGNTYFWEDVKLKMAISSAARFWPFVKGYLDTDQVDRDVDSIRNLYIEEGFLDVEVGRKITFSDDKKNAYLTFVINQNGRYRVNKVIFEGNKIFSDAELSRRIHFQQGDFFTALAMRRNTKTVQDTYGQLGYIYAKVEARKQFLNPEGPVPDWAKALGRPPLLNVIYTIVEADKYTVGKVVIRGNMITQAHVIRRELRFFPAKLYDTVAVEESKKALTEARLFDEVTVTPSGNEPGVRDAVVDVKEGKTADFTVGVGYSTRDGLLGNITITQRNFDILAWPSSKRQIAQGEALKGDGQTFRITLEPGTQVMRAEIDWFNPYIFDQPYSLDVKIFGFNRVRETYTETRVGPVVAVGHRFKNNWYGELAARVEDVNINHLTDGAPPEVTSVSGDNFLAGLKGTLARDNTDSRLMPTEGDSLRLSYEEVTGDFSFGRAEADYHFYKTLYQDSLDRKHILANRFSIGQIFGDSPVFENFYGGGQGSVRGFEYRGISPHSAGTNEQIGGKFSVFAGSEYTFPLVAELLRGILFVNSGTVEKDFEVTTYRVSVGFGLQIVIPFMGPVPMEVDFGFPILKGNQDNTQLVNFNVGWTF